MLQISKFKLIDQGRGGIDIEGKESIVMHGNYAVIDKVKRQRRLMLAPDVIAKVQELKYFFFNLTAHWLPPFNKYYDFTNHRLEEIELDEDGKMKQGQSMLRNLWSITDITGISYKNGGFVITGEINSVENKKVVINTPFITEADDVGFFSEAIDKIDECIKLIIEYIDRKELPSYDPKALLSSDDLKDNDINNLSKKVIDKLVDKGMIVLINEKDDYPSLPFSKTVIHDKTGNIDGDNLQEAKEHIETEKAEEIDEWTLAEAERKDKEIRDKMNPPKDPFGKPASVADEFPIQEGDYRDNVNASGEDLSMHEYSDDPPGQVVESDDSEVSFQ